MSEFLEVAHQALGLLVPRLKVYLDTEKFAPVSNQVYQSMHDCMRCGGIAWYPDNQRDYDRFNALPEEARKLAYQAMDPLERGYCISIYRALHPDWPDRTFLFLVAYKDGKRWFYEYPTGEPVEMTLLLKKLAERLEFWSWRSGIAKAYMIMSALFPVIWLAFFLLQGFVTSPDPPDPFWFNLFIGVACLFGTLFPIVWPPYAWNRETIRIKRCAGAL